MRRAYRRRWGRLAPVSAAGHPSCAGQRRRRAPCGACGGRCPRQDSNLRACLRRAPLYPLSYGGQEWSDLISGAVAVRNQRRTGAARFLGARCIRRRASAAPVDVEAAARAGVGQVVGRRRRPWSGSRAPGPGHGRRARAPSLPGDHGGPHAHLDRDAAARGGGIRRRPRAGTTSPSRTGSAAAGSAPRNVALAVGGVAVAVVAALGLGGVFSASDAATGGSSGTSGTSSVAVHSRFGPVVHADPTSHSRLGPVVRHGASRVTGSHDRSRPQSSSARHHRRGSSSVAGGLPSRATESPREDL